jgi:LacI family transcriptional regulator
VLKRGARRIVLLEEDLPITTVRERIAGFAEALSAAGLPMRDDAVARVPTVRHEQVALPWRPDEAYRLCRGLLESAEPPDAVVVGNDYYALGLYRALADHGLRVADDVLVVGYGDYPFAEFLSPALSTVRLPAQEVGTTAVDLLLERVAGNGETQPVKRLISPRFVERASTG